MLVLLSKVCVVNLRCTLKSVFSRYLIDDACSAVVE